MSLLRRLLRALMGYRWPRGIEQHPSYFKRTDA
jgi:hypothetical protein